jgi:hypothetical protein
MGGEARSVTRSSLNDTTNVPMSARSVSFKEPVIHETYDPPSSTSQQTTTIVAGDPHSVLNRIGIFFF